MIETAKAIAKESEAVIKMARKVADACTDKRMKRVRPVCMYVCVHACLCECVCMCVHMLVCL